MMDLKQFLELFNPLPGNHYIQVTTSPDETTSALDELMKDVEGEFRIAHYIENESDTASLYPEAKVQYIKNLSHPFRALPRDNDIVIFKDIFHLHKNKKLLLKTAYTTLANSANIIIMDKKGSFDVEELKELLEEYEFRSANLIDVLPEYDLVMAKKMHMWGNGL